MSKYICQDKEKQQYISGTVGMFIESSAKHSQSLG